MKVSVAAKPLSASVAAASNTMCSFGHPLPAETVFTAELALFINNVCDSLNMNCVGNYKKSVILFSKESVSHYSQHIQFWYEALMEIEQ